MANIQRHVRESKGELPDFRMHFEPLTIDHLGLRLYSTLPPVIGELVSNAYDAESPTIDITLPHGAIKSTSAVVVRDYGHGMTPSEVADQYLPIGRPRRGPDETNVMSKNKKRRVLGRKGLGKLSAFGIATEMDVRTISSGQAVCLRLNYDTIKAWIKSHPGKDYSPQVVSDQTGPTKDSDGVCVTLRYLHRKSPIDATEVRKGLARRLTVIGHGFEVRVNGTAIGPGDRVSKADCAKGFSWDVGQLPHGGGKLGSTRVITGWIGFLDSSSQANRGIDIFAFGKSVELGSFFNYASTHAQFARAHLVGEIHADFLDEEKDLISTARNSVVWESDVAMELQDWGHKTLKWVFDQWIELRKQEKEVAVVKAAGFDKWLTTRPAREQKVATRMLRMLVDDEKLDPSSAQPLLEIIKGSVESVAFRDLLEQIEDDGISVKALLKLFKEWRIIEAREHLNIADGRFAAIQQLEKYMRTGALEVQEMQPLFDNHPWLIDQAWKESDRQTTYTALIQKHCKEPKGLEEKDRRIDIFGVRASGGVTLVEIKRPDKTLAQEDLSQIESYVDWARGAIVSSGHDAPKYVNGLLIVGKLNASHKRKQERLAGDDIRVETYTDLRDRAKEIYRAVEERLMLVAPEYMKARKKNVGKKK